MNTDDRENEAVASAARRSAPWSKPVARVRQLLARMEKSQHTLDWLTHAAEEQIARLTPRLAVLETTAFGALPDLVWEQAQASDEPARARQKLELPELSGAQRGRSPASILAPDTSPGTQAERPVAPTAHHKRPVPALRLRRAGTAASSQISEPQQTQSAAPLSLHAADAAPAKESAQSLAPVAQSARVVDLGSLVNRVLRERGQSAQVSARFQRTTENASPAIARPVQVQHADLATEAVPAATSAAAPSLLPRRAAFRLARAALYPAVQPRMTADRMQQDRIAVQPGELLDLAAPFRRAEPVFFFDPLEPRLPSDDADQTLAERINDVLREQARRQGVDLT